MDAKSTEMKPSCDMVKGCAKEVTHIDQSGFVYCTGHGSVRKQYEPCRKLRPHEAKRLARGLPLKRY